jgi:signal transduction histidine kinase
MTRGLTIRGRLVALVIGAVVPLTAIGLVALWSVWGAKQERLDQALEQEAELAAVVFDRWLDAQRQSLVTIAASPPERRRDTAALESDLAAAAAPRAHWVDVRALDAAGATLAAHPATAPALPEGLGERLVAEARRTGSAVETDWTRGEGRYLLALAARAGDGAVVARVDGAALAEQFRGLTLPDRALVTIVDPSRRIIFRSQDPAAAVGAELGESETLAALESEPTSAVHVRSGIDGVERVYGLARVGETGYAVTVGVPSEVLYAPAWRQFSTYALVSLLAAIAIVAAALLVSRSIARPMRILSEAAEQFGEGDFSARAPTAGDHEISRLAASFNAMADRLEAREARMAEIDRLKTDFVSSVSHELRTPLTTIKALTRLLNRDGLPAEKRREYLDTIAAECDRQIDLVLNLLDLSRIEGGVFRTALGRVEVPEIVESCAKAAARGAAMRGHEVRVDVDPATPPACADAKALGRVLGNVVENAIKYTPDGGRIELAARGAGDWVEVSVADNGRGIPPEDVPRLFDKFHRGRDYAAAAPQSGNPDEVDVSGVGLGLYLARNVMEQMGGHISVDTEVGRGTTFTLHLRRWRAAAGADSRGEERADAEAVTGG